MPENGETVTKLKSFCGCIVRWPFSYPQVIFIYDVAWHMLPSMAFCGTSKTIQYMYLKFRDM